MLSMQVLRKLVEDAGEITGALCSIWSMEGVCLAISDKRQTPLKQTTESIVEDFQKEGKAGNTRQWFYGADKGVFVVKDMDEPVYLLVMEGIPLEALKMAGKLCACQIQTILQLSNERLSRQRFVMELLLDNLLLVDILNRAKKLHIKNEQRRALYVIEPKKNGHEIVLEAIRSSYAGRTQDFVVSLDDNKVILIKSLDEGNDEETQIRQTAYEMIDMLRAEALIEVRIAYGMPANDLKEVSKSYKEAIMALDIGCIFYEQKSILAYNQLGIGRLIYQLPLSLCEMFLNEVFEGKAETVFDEETLTTVYKFFQNNLNISETARQLYIHRNTLVYRLEKIQKKTGLDVRFFDDAMTFKIALMVSGHVRHMKECE